MDMFTSVSSDYYLRKYEINPTLTFGHRVTVSAVCDLNQSGMNGHYYSLELYFSVDDYPTKDHIITVSFGSQKMEREEIDSEIDTWVRQYMDEVFVERIHLYIKKEELMEDYLDREEAKARE